MKRPLISILIVSYRTPELLRQTLRSILEHVTLPFEVIVTDNASGDATVPMLRREFPWVKLIASSENLGFAAGNNRAFELASGDYTFFLNPDTRVTPGAVETLVRELEEHPGIALTAPRLHYPDGSLQRSVRDFYSFGGSLLDNRIWPALLPKKGGRTGAAFWDHASRREIDWAKGAALMVRTSVLREIGLFDEQFWIYGEEIDLCMRIRNAGYRIAFLPEAVIIHYEKQSTRQHSTRMFIQNYRSHYLLLRKHYPKKDLMLYFTRSVMVNLIWLALFALRAPFQTAARESLGMYAGLFRYHMSLQPLRGAYGA